MKRFYIVILFLFSVYLLFPCAVFSEEVGLGEHCENDSECVTKLCIYSTCSNCSKDAECPDGRFCSDSSHYCVPKLENNSDCDRNEFCKSGLCENSICTNVEKKSGCCEIDVKQDDVQGGVRDLTRMKLVDSEQACYLIFSATDNLPEMLDPNDVKQSWNFKEGVCEPTTETTAPTSTKLTPDMPTNIGNLNQLNTKGSAGLPALIGNLISKALGVVGSIALAMFVYGGLLWMSSAGNAERQKKAVNVIVWASFGIIIILSSYVVVKFVFSVL